MLHKNLIALNAVNVEVPASPLKGELKRATCLKLSACDPAAVMACIIIAIARAVRLRVAAYKLSVGVLVLSRLNQAHGLC